MSNETMPKKQATFRAKIIQGQNGIKLSGAGLDKKSLTPMLVVQLFRALGRAGYTKPIKNRPAPDEGGGFVPDSFEEFFAGIFHGRIWLPIEKDININPLANDSDGDGIDDDEDNVSDDIVGEVQIIERCIVNPDGTVVCICIGQ